ncbi:MAG: hypothetical protein GY830_10095 [Bacteroidetes bacterium]|nr:hypothetical protein [Bacteroidota bacterium]
MTDIIIVDNNLFFVSDIEDNLGLLKIPANLEEECLLRYNNLTSYPVNISLNPEPFNESIQRNISVEDIETDFLRLFEFNSSIICKNGMFPTNDPTNDPTSDPTNDPTIDPTNDPTIDPTNDPTSDPTNDPTNDPTSDPTNDPTSDPTNDPTSDPTNDPTSDPTDDPTDFPTTSQPTTETPTNNPTKEPTVISPTGIPTLSPTLNESSSLEDDSSLEIILPIVLGVVAILVLLALIYFVRHRKSFQYLTVAETEYNRDLELYQNDKQL